MGFTIENLARLFIGLQGESNARQIDIDMSEWVRDWPNAKVDVLVQRPGEDNTYPVETELRGGHLLWTPQREDVLIAGMGKAQIILTDKNDVELRSRVVQTIIGESIAGTEGNAPDPVQGWVHEVLQAASEVKASVDAGEGGLYIVNVERRGELQSRYADRTQEEIREAVANRKTCVLVNSDGRVCVYIGEKEYPHDPYPVCPTFVAPMEYKQGQGFTYWQMQVLPSGGIAEPGYKPAKTPNPKKLTIKQGETTTKYDGSEDVELEIPDGVPDPGKAHQQLVSDADGKAVWEERLAYKHVQSGMVTLFAEEALVGALDEPGTYFSATPLTAMPEVGKTYEVTINGTVYNTTAHTWEEDGVQIAVILGNAGNMNPEVYPDTGEPFMLVVPLPEHQAMMGGMSVIMVTDIETDSITLSIKGQATITTIKKIDPEYIPDTHKTITLTIDADGNVTSDTPFAEAWAMTPGELQAAIVIKESSQYKGETIATVDAVSKAEGGFVPTMYGGRMINLRVRKAYLDVSDLGDKDTTRFLTWVEGGVGIATEQSYSLPVLPVGQQSYVGRYARYNGSTWDAVTIDQLKADLGLT